MAYEPIYSERKWTSSIRFVNAAKAETIIRKRIPGPHILQRQGKFVGSDTHMGEVRMQEFYGKSSALTGCLTVCATKKEAERA